jgi:large subunit ribosomal protein L18
MKITHNRTSEQKRKLRVRAKVRGTAERPRLHVHRSNKSVYLQVINDAAGKTLASATSLKAKKDGTKTDMAKVAATQLAEALKKLKITKLVFDRGGYRYHGRVRTVADVMREQGLEV